MAIPRQKRGKLSAQGINDFRFGIDRVERQGDKAFVVDPDGLYAPVEVDGDFIPPSFADRISDLSPAQATAMFEAIRLTPFLSREGKEERMRILLQSGKVRFTFQIVPKGHSLEEVLG
jgi:hypothetical protein